MKTLMSLILLMFALPSVAAPFASLDMETAVEQRLRTMIAPLDPHAQVVVRVEFDDTPVNLPGADAILLSLTAPKKRDEINLQDLKKFEVKILYSMDELPAWLKTEIENVLPVKPSIKKISYEKLDTATLEKIKSRSLYEVALGAGTQFMTVFVVFAVVILFCGILVAFALSRGSRALSSVVQEQIRNIVSSLDGGGFGSTQAPIIDVTPERPALGAGKGDNSNNTIEQIKQLSSESLLAIFSDCYWTSEDRYAAWLWMACSMTQKQNLLSQWPFMDAYAASFSGVIPVQRDDHVNSIYLLPPPIENVSQEDLSQWLEANPKCWHGISPMRQYSLKISLIQKIKLIETKPSQREEHSWPKVKSQPRELKTQVMIGGISLEDEVQILASPESIPEHLRREVPSLVWLKLKSQSEREAILSRISAQDIAAAWVGPNELLAELEASIPAKKLNLVKGYLRQSRPSRQSPAFQMIMKMSLENKVEVKEA